jgi:uncharacterized protein YciI
MPVFALMCRDKPGALETRLANRPAHPAYLGDNVDRVRMAGPLLDEAGEMCGTLVVFEAADLDAAQTFAAADPYAQAGLFAETRIQGLNPTIGSWVG